MSDPTAIFPCPPLAGIWLWGILPGLVIGYGVRWFQVKYQLQFIRHFDHSQAGTVVGPFEVLQRGPK